MSPTLPLLEWSPDWPSLSGDPNRLDGVVMEGFVIEGVVIEDAAMEDDTPKCDISLVDLSLTTPMLDRPFTYDTLPPESILFLFCSNRLVTRLALTMSFILRDLPLMLLISCCLA